MAKKSNPIKEWLKATLVPSGFKISEFSLGDNYVLFYVKDMPFSRKNRISASLSQIFPSFSFEWDRNKLSWY